MNIRDYAEEERLVAREEAIDWALGLIQKALDTEDPVAALDTVTSALVAEMNRLYDLIDTDETEEDDEL